MGLEATTITIEVNLTRGVMFHLSGLADTAVKESYDCICAALPNVGFKTPTANLTINLSPADLKKEGSGFDLPMAIGILGADGKIDCDRLQEYMLIGELGLDGKLKPVRAYVALQEHLVSYCDQIIDIDGITQIVITDSEYNSSTHYLSITDNIALTEGEWYVVYDSRGECICNYAVNPQFIYLYGSFEPGQSYLLSVRKYKIGKMYSEQQIGIVG